MTEELDYHQVCSVYRYNMKSSHDNFISRRMICVTWLRRYGTARVLLAHGKICMTLFWLDGTNIESGHPGIVCS